MADNHDARDAEPVQHVAKNRRLRGRRARDAAPAIAPTLSRPVRQNDTTRDGEPFAERPQIFKIAAGAVQQNDRRRAGGCVRAKLENVLAQTAGRDEESTRRKAALDHARSERRHDRASAKERKDNKCNHQAHCAATMRLSYESG